MALLVPQLLAYLIVWPSGVTGFAFTNSFNDWVGNTTYRIDWSTSSSDPSIYDLALVQPRSIYSTDIAPNVSWPDQWSHKYAIQIPINGDRFIQVALGSDVWPGVYYWRMSSVNQTTAVSNTFLISSSSGATNPTTITSLVPVTATEDVVQTSDGHIVTYKPSDIYSSAVIYTTIIVISDGNGKGAALTKVPIIVGIALALIFFITLPIIVWLVLRYRRPRESSGGKPTPLDLDGVHNSSVLNLMPSNASAVDSTAPHAAPMEATTRRVWAIVDGEKKLVTISQDPLRPTTPAVDSDPFADPSTPTTLKSARRILVPTNASASDHDSSSSSVNPYDPLLFRANTTTNSLSATFSFDIPSISTHTNSASVGQRPEKTPERAGQRLHLEHHALSEEEIASRIIVPGRAVDMGPFGRNHIQNVDEDGLLPPDYFQATQPIPSLQPPQAGPSTR